MDNVFLKPAVEGAVVPDPESHRPLAAAGEWKPRSLYWERRIRDNDVVVADPPKESPAVPAPKVSAAAAAATAPAPTPAPAPGAAPATNAKA